jgi:hypothetical protein
VITEQQAIERILSHLSLTRPIYVLGSSGPIGCDISDVEIAEWEWNEEESIEQRDEREPLEESLRGN